MLSLMGELSCREARKCLTVSNSSWNPRSRLSGLDGLLPTSSAFRNIFTEKIEDEFNTVFTCCSTYSCVLLQSYSKIDQIHFHLKLRHRAVWGRRSARLHQVGWWASVHMFWATAWHSQAGLWCAVVSRCTVWLGQIISQCLHVIPTELQFSLISFSILCYSSISRTMS